MLIEFLLLTAAIAQASKIVSESYVFEWLRNRLARISDHLGEGISCQLCTGTWMGLAAALVAPTLTPIEPGLLAWFADGMALAFAGRLLYSAQETVLASSFWLERGNQPPPLNFEALHEALEGAHSHTVNIDHLRQVYLGAQTLDRPEGSEAGPLEINKIEREEAERRSRRVTEPTAEEAPQEDATDRAPRWVRDHIRKLAEDEMPPPDDEPFLVEFDEFDWEEDWRDIAEKLD